jgi:competence protein ComEC
MKISHHISNHPFIFLFSLVLMASFCIGGVVILFRIGSSVALPVSFLATETVRSQGKAESTQSEPAKALNEITATSVTAPFVSAAETPIPELVATSTTVGSSVRTMVPLPTRVGAPLIVTFIDVGQGDSIMIEAPDGQIAMIDGGSAGSGSLAYLQSEGVRNIDVMIATHLHEDHIGGLVEVLNALPVKKVITDGQVDTSSTYEQFLDGIANAQAEYVEVSRGDTIDMGGLTFSVLSPMTVGISEDLNSYSLVLMLRYGKTSFLFMGDADMDAEARILTVGNPGKADILKIGDHGSCISSSPKFLDAVQPEVAIYFAELNNPYNLPCAGTISALNERGIFILGTDVNGTIIVTVSPDGYTITNSTDGSLMK